MHKILRITSGGKRNLTVEPPVKAVGQSLDVVPAKACENDLANVGLSIAIGVLPIAVIDVNPPRLCRTDQPVP